MFKNKEAADRYYRSYWKKVKATKPHLERTYGITIDDYNDMFTFQEGKCAGCNKHQTELKTALHVDHCHSTGKIRGLLCGKCNRALGLVKDNIVVLRKMITYLEDVKPNDSIKS